MYPLDHPLEASNYEMQQQRQSPYIPHIARIQLRHLRLFYVTGDIQTNADECNRHICCG